MNTFQLQAEEVNVSTARQILGDIAEEMTDGEIEKIISNLRLLSNKVICSVVGDE